MKSARLCFLMLLIFIACKKETTTSFTEVVSSESPNVAVATPNPALNPGASPTPSEPICTPAERRLCPKDEGVSDASFASFRAQMSQAVERRDSPALLKMIHPKIRTSFGDGGGIGDFRKQWKMESSDSPLWNELAFILNNGGSFLGEGANRPFWAPYIYSAWPEPYDAFSHVAAVTPGVAIRSKPDAAAKSITSADWEILELPDTQQEPPEGWRRVRTATGVEGWVAEEDVRSPVGYRAGFHKENGVWRMNALVAGD